MDNPLCNGGNDALDASTEIKWKNFSSYQKAEYIMNHKPDCSFVVGHSDSSLKTFSCHKWIIKDASEVIGAMLLNGHFKESTNPHGIRIDDTNPDSFQKFLQFIYYGDIGKFEAMDISTIRDLIFLGKKYLISELTDLCIAMIKQNLINAENRDLLCVFEYSYFVEDQKLISKCKKVIVERKPKCISVNPFKFNLNTDEDKKVISHKKNSFNVPASGTVNRGTKIFGSSNTNGFGLTCEEQNTKTEANSIISENDIPSKKEKNFIEPEPNRVINFGMDKGDIMLCSYIYKLSPPVFYEFQKTMTSYASEFERFSIIETYAKINALRFEIDHVENSEVNNINENEIVKKIINNEDQASNESINSAQEDVKGQDNNTLPERNEMLNMMLHCIDFLQMSAKEFCRGPRHSTLLTTEEKLTLLTSIVNKS